MASIQRTPAHSTGSTNIADLLERVLDKGVVIAGDIKVSLVDIELLSIQIRLVICSVDKAKEMGMDWWVNHPVFSAQKAPDPALTERTESALASLESRLGSIEQSIRSLSSQAVPPTLTPSQPAAAAPTVPEWARAPRPGA